MIPALSRQQVERLVERFASLNPYNPRYVPDSILKIESVNDDANGRPRDLLGFAISAKRYALYERRGNRLAIRDAKGHGLGYLYPPTGTDSERPWTWDAWDWILRAALRVKATRPSWLNTPAMMRVVLSTPLVLNRLNRDTRPYNFLLCPLVDSVVGYPCGVDRGQFTLIAPFTKDRNAWRTLTCVNACDGKPFTLSMEQDARGSKAVPQTLEYVLRLYLRHAESKSLAPDGSPSSGDTRGVLQRASVQAGGVHYVGKETDRRWEHGEDLSLLQFKVQEYRPARGTAVADRALRARLAALGMRALMRRTGLSQHTIERVMGGRAVRPATLRRVAAAVRGES